MSDTDSEHDTLEKIGDQQTVVHRRNRTAPLNKRCVSVISQDSFGSMAVSLSLVPVNDVNDDVTKGVAPDGGYGWVILAMSFLSFGTLGFMYGGFPVMYDALVERFQSDRGVTGWIGSMYVFMGSVFGIVFGAFVPRYGCRVVGMAGAIVGSIGIALSAFLVSIPYLYITYGVIAGCGNAMVVISSLVILQQYFDRRRPFALAFGMMGMSAAAVVAVPAASALIDAYGLGGTYLISSGIWLQNLVFASMFKPIKVSCESRHESETGAKKESDVTNCSVAQNSKTGNEGMSPKTSEVQRSQMDCGRTIFREMLDFTPLKNRRLALYVAGNFLSAFGSIAFFAHYMSRLNYLGIDKRTCVILQMSLEATTTVFRIIYSLILTASHLNRVTFITVLIAISGVVVFTFAFVHNVAMLALFGTLHGIVAAGYFSMHHSVLIDVAGRERVARTTAIFNLTYASGAMMGTPLLGEYIIQGCCNGPD